MKKRMFACLLALVLMMTVLPVFAEEAEKKPVIVIYTNDVHCGVEEGMGYAGVAAYRKAYEEQGYETILVDAGDAIQGGTIGTISAGEYIVDIMNMMRYDVAAPGNHEFDYGITRLQELVEMADYPYVCCNLKDMDGNTLFDGYTIIEKGGWKIAFIGITTPYTVVTCNPVYFKNEAGEYIYDFCGDGADDLYSVVQETVDAARAEGADIVIALSHLGTDEETFPFTSGELISYTTGIDIVLDAHSHSIWEGEKELNAAGETVIMSSTGTRLETLGVLTISADGKFSTELHRETIFQDADAKAYIATIKEGLSETLEEVVAHTDVALTISDPTAVTEKGTPVRIVRNMETNLGDLCADAIRYATGADIGFYNGGGVRATIPAGDITYGDIVTVAPFSNSICLCVATGQMILDTLEYSVSALPNEFGGFLQVSGITFDVDTSIPTPVKKTVDGQFEGISGARRVSNVKVNGVDIDPEKTYKVGASTYLIRDGGDGHVCLQQATILADEIMTDNAAMITYIVEELEGMIGSQYADPYGEGRITIHN